MEGFTSLRRNVTNNSCELFAVSHHRILIKRRFLQRNAFVVIVVDTIMGSVPCTNKNKHLLNKKCEECLKEVISVL